MVTRTKSSALLAALAAGALLVCSACGEGTVSGGSIAGDADGPTCTDGIVNGDESDVDCGGGCPNLCATGDSCLVHGDCETGRCTASVCEAIPAGCGDGSRGSGEDCDGLDLDGATCATAGDFDGGDLACEPNCLFDTAGCRKCGNSSLDLGELCDGALHGSATCGSVGDFDGGTLACDANCAWDTSGCRKCGNSSLDLDELCDGALLGSATCASVGDFDGGTLACDVVCAWDTSGCRKCGNGTKDPGEACDGTLFGTETCASQGFSGGGTLACSLDCTEIVTNQCLLACSPYGATSTVDTVGPTWSLMGPPGAHVAALHALSGGVVLAGTGRVGGSSRIAGSSCGIYRSIDHGDTFTRTVDCAGGTVTSLTEAAAGRVYAGIAGASTGVDAIWLSDNGGQSFSGAAAGLHAAARVRAISVAAGTPERVYAMIAGSPAAPDAAVATLYRRDDNGSWIQVGMAGVDPSPGGPAFALLADPADRERIYVADGARFYVSDDAGENFAGSAFGSTVFPPSGLRSVSALYAEPGSITRFYLTTSDAETFISEDSGQTWAPVDSLGIAANALAFAPGQVFAATAGTGLRSLSNGSISRVAQCIFDPVVTSVAVAPDDPQRVYAGSTGLGVVRSTDGGVTFAPQQGGIDELLARPSITGPSGSPTTWLLSAAGLFSSADLGTTWSRTAEAAGTLCMSVLALDPTNADRVLVGTNEDLFAGGGSGVGVFALTPSDGGVVPSTGLTGKNVIALAFDPGTSGRVVTYQQSGLYESPMSVVSGIFSSTNAGGTFAPTAALGDSLATRSAFRYSPMAVAADGTLFMGTYLDPGGAALWRSTDAGATHEQVWTDAAIVPSGVYVDAAGDVYITGEAAQGLLRSVDQGDTFTPHGAGLTSFALIIYDLAFTSAGGIVLATQDGVYYAADGVNFSAINDGFSPVPTPWFVAVAPGTPETVIVGTDMGVYRRELP